jgi:hypothetical protein
METLFDDLERTLRRATRQTDDFTFLNQAAGQGWSAVRDELERWFSLYCEDAPPEKARDLRARFRERDPRQHLGAWWELYTHRLLRALCPERLVEVEPPLEGIGTKADFVIFPSDGATPELVVESTTTVSGIVTAKERESLLLASVLDTIDEVHCPEFQVHLDLRIVGTEQPRKRQIQEPIERWLATLNYEAELAKRTEQRFWERPSKRITFRGWEIEVQPIPMRTPIEDKRLIGIGPSVAGYVDDRDRIKQKVLEKAGHYGSLDAPFVVALAPTSPILHEHDVVGGLLGTPTRKFDPDHPEAGELFLVRDGAWGDGAENVSAVLTGAAIVPWTVAKYAPILWLNPSALHPLDDCFHRLPRVEFTELGETVTHEPSVSIAELLGLDPEWPGEL